MSATQLGSPSHDSNVLQMEIVRNSSNFFFSLAGESLQHIFRMTSTCLVLVCISFITTALNCLSMHAWFQIRKAWAALSGFNCLISRAGKKFSFRSGLQLRLKQHISHTATFHIDMKICLCETVNKCSLFSFEQVPFFIFYFYICHANIILLWASSFSQRQQDYFSIFRKEEIELQNALPQSHTP